MVPAAVRELHDRGKAAWPDVDLDLDAFGDHVAARLHAPDELEAMRPEGMYIAAACALGVEPAVRALRRKYEGRIVAALARIGTAAAADEVLQRVYERVLVRGGDGVPDIVKYDGRGDLGAWLVTVAVREAYRVVRASRRNVSPREPDLEAAVEQSDQELSYLKSHYREHFRAAFRQAVRDLTGRERNLLRYQYVHALTYEQIAAIYGIGRATAARWLTSAKQSLMTGTRVHLKANLRCAEPELESVMKLVQSQIDVTLSGLMGTTHGPEEKE